MYFALKIIQLGSLSGSSSKLYRTPAIYPFPLIGKFKVRVVGFDCVTATVPAPGGIFICLASRALLNPLQPEAFFSFIPQALSNDGVSVSNFTQSGWWEVNLDGSIDILPRFLTINGTYSEETFQAFITLHLEFEKLDA